MQYVAIKTAQNDFYNCTFLCYNCTIRHQLHTKICPGVYSILFDEQVNHVKQNTNMFKLCNLLKSRLIYARFSVYGRYRVGIVGGFWLNSPVHVYRRSFLSMKIGYFNRWAKFQTFRHLIDPPVLLGQFQHWADRYKLTLYERINENITDRPNRQRPDHYHSQ